MASQRVRFFREGTLFSKRCWTIREEQIDLKNSDDETAFQKQSFLSVLSLVVVLLAGQLSPIAAQKAAPILERIARSIPEREEHWKLVSKESQVHNDGSAQASFRWTEGVTRVGATVIIHRSLKSAKKAFEPHDKNDPHEDFQITGIGDKAYLWPPKAPTDGAYNLRFRRGKVEVWMSGASEDLLKRCAQYVAASIP